MPRSRLMVGGLVVAAVVVAAYAVAFPPFAPLDERAHWLTVKLYGRGLFLPVLAGNARVPYEALQQGPVYYLLAAALVRVMGGVSFAAFIGLRFAGIPMFLATCYLDVRIAALVRRDDLRWMPAALLFLVAVSPALASVFGGVQNDGLAILGTTVAIYTATRWLAGGHFGVGRALALGAVVGLSALTKSNAAFLLFSIPVAMVLVLRRRALLPVAVMLAAALAVCGWWFVRNYALYGDLTGQAALLRLPAGTAPTPVALGSILRAPITVLFPWISWFRTTAVTAEGQADWVIGPVRHASYLLLGVGVVGAVLRRPRPLEMGILAHVVVAWTAFVAALVFTNASLSARTTFAVLPLALVLLIQGWAEAGRRLRMSRATAVMTGAAGAMFVAVDLAQLAVQFRRR